MKIAYADPPYPGCANYYKERTEVDSASLVRRLDAEYDGWLLHTHSNALRDILPVVPKSARLMAWVKPFAAFKRNVSVAYAWEPVIVKAARKPVVAGRAVMRDWIAASSTLQKGLVGAKPLDVCLWAFEVLGMEAGDELVDLYPGTGAVTMAWAAFKQGRAPRAAWETHTCPLTGETLHRPAAGQTALTLEEAAGREGDDHG